MAAPQKATPGGHRASAANQGNQRADYGTDASADALLIATFARAGFTLCRLTAGMWLVRRWGWSAELDQHGLARLAQRLEVEP